jgi:hypothetical protein
MLLYLAVIKNYIMTVGEIKQKLIGIDDNMKVGGAGHFGELLECYFAEVRPVHKSRMDDSEEIIFCISIVNAGDEPN